MGQWRGGEPFTLRHNTTMKAYKLTVIASLLTGIAAAVLLMWGVHSATLLPYCWPLDLMFGAVFAIMGAMITITRLRHYRVAYRLRDQGVDYTILEDKDIDTQIGVLNKAYCPPGWSYWRVISWEVTHAEAVELIAEHKQNRNQIKGSKWI